MAVGGRVGHVSRNPKAIVSRSVASIRRDHVTFELEAIDRLYLNGYVSQLQYPSGFVGSSRYHQGLPIVSTAAVAPMTRRFVEGTEEFAIREGVDLIRFRKNERKDEVAKRYQARAEFEEGVLFIGKAQEMASIPRTQKRHSPETGASYPWVVWGTAMVNYYY